LEFFGEKMAENGGPAQRQSVSRQFGAVSVGQLQLPRASRRGRGAQQGQLVNNEAAPIDQVI
jgi:hypothetical protein